MQNYFWTKLENIGDSVIEVIRTLMQNRKQPSSREDMGARTFRNNKRISKRKEREKGKRKELLENRK